LHSPIVALTAHSASKELETTRLSGMDDPVVEPARATHLREITSRWLRAANVLLEYPANVPGLLERDACKFGDVVKHQRGLAELVADACRCADFESAERYVGAMRRLEQRHDCAATCDETT